LSASSPIRNLPAKAAAAISIHISVPDLRALIYGYLGPICHRWIVEPEQYRRLLADKDRNIDFIPERLCADIGSTGDIEAALWLMSSDTFGDGLNFVIMWLSFSSHNQLGALQTLYHSDPLRRYIDPQALIDATLVEFTRCCNLEAIIWLREQGASNVWAALCRAVDRVCDTDLQFTTVLGGGGVTSMTWLLHTYYAAYVVYDAEDSELVLQTPTHVLHIYPERKAVFLYLYTWAIAIGMDAAFMAHKLSLFVNRMIG